MTPPFLPRARGRRVALCKIVEAQMQLKHCFSGDRALHNMRAARNALLATRSRFEIENPLHGGDSSEEGDDSVG